ncbi:MAG TPA: AMP-binding protein, partial [Gammaproteobacteria bacterium]|nr:AMP-binding protein [Gammaproteobacteria bacterium]
IFADEKEYGITFHVIPPGEKRVDVGDIILERPVQIDAVHDTAESLSVKCQRAALDGFTELLEKITCDELKPRLQGADVIATAPARTYKLQRRMKDHGLISWEDRAEHIERLYRSLTAQQNYLGSIKFSIQNDIFIPGLVKIEDERSHTPGEIVRITDTEIVMATQTKHIVLSNIRDADGQEISIAQLVSRYGLTAKTLLTGLLVPKQLIARPFNDLFWERILRRITATELPFYAAREASAIPEETVDGLTKTVSSTLRQSLAQKFKGYSNEHILLTAVLIYFYRIFDNESSVVNLSSFEGQKNVKGLESFCAQYTPFPIGQLKPDILFAQALTYVAEQLKDLEKHGAFERDIFLRLKIPHCPLPVAVALCENGDTTDVVKGCPKGTKILVVVSKTGQITCIAAPSLTHVSLHVVAHLMALLESIDQHPADQCIITQLNFLTPEDFILAEKIFQGTPLQRMDDFIFPDQLVAYHAGEQPTQGSLAVFTRLARGHCKKMTAVISKGDHALVYFELAKKAQYMAGYLQSHYQIKKGDRVAICLDQSLLSITTLIALMKVGAVIVPIDPAQGRDFVNHLLQDIDPALLITRTEISYRFTGQGGESAWSSCKKLSLDHKNLSKIFTSAHAKQVTVAERQPND